MAGRAWLVTVLVVTLACGGRGETAGDAMSGADVRRDVAGADVPADGAPGDDVGAHDAIDTDAADAAPPDGAGPESPDAAPADGSGPDAAPVDASSFDTPAPEVDVTPPASLAFLTPGATAANPVTFTVAATGPIARVAYVADGQWPLGESTDPAGFPVAYTFQTLGARVIEARGFAADGLVPLATASLTVVVQAAPVAGLNRLGAWLWTIEGTGYSHAELAAKLHGLGVKRVFVKVADGGADCTWWPELCDASVPAAYHAEGLEAWGWSYDYPGDEAAQAQALYQAAASGYDGYALDLETEFDGLTDDLEALLQAFTDARASARADGLIGDAWPLVATTWGNPADHGMHVEIIDAHVDAHLPQTYLEVWGESYMADPAHWVAAGTCEYRALGALKPVHHIVSTEYGLITPDQLNAFVHASGPQTSLWRVPGDGTSEDIWDDWAAVDWAAGDFATESCP